MHGGMEFKDLPLFNKALLGKQGWRLITKPESLCARVLKGRYFYDGDFIHTNWKNHASHTWRAILAGRDVLMEGLIRRTGNGITTKVWGDRWIANHQLGRPFTTAAEDRVRVVSNLINVSGWWNEELVREIFCDFDAEAILSTPCNGSGDDFLAWDPEKHGVYFVRSAYRMLETKQRMSHGGDRPGSSSDTDWKEIWKLEVPPKVRIFWWRVLHEFLPTRQVLHRRHIEKIANCEVCGEPKETIKHVLVDCTVARSFWRQARTITGVKLPHLHEVTWARDLLHPEFCPRRRRS